VRIGVSVGQNISGKLSGMKNNAASLDKPKALIPAKWGAVGAIIAIMVITVLEYPAPIGFETRPQTNVSPLWGLFFLIIVITEIVAIPLIFRRPSLGQKLGIVAGILNILQVIADQAHLLQPEVSPLGYSVLEGLVVIASLVLIYFCLKLEY
jgi:hypothetical protein